MAISIRNSVLFAAYKRLGIDRKGQLLFKKLPVKKQKDKK